MRIFLAVFLFISVFAFPLWITVPLAVYFLFLYDKPYELVGIALAVDLVFGIPGNALLSTRFVVTVGVVVSILVISITKSYLRFYEYLPSKQKRW